MDIVTFYTARYGALAAAQFIVIGPVCLLNCLWVGICYHDNSKLCASIIAKTTTNWI